MDGDHTEADEKLQAQIERCREAADGAREAIERVRLACYEVARVLEQVIQTWEEAVVRRADAGQGIAGPADDPNSTATSTTVPPEGNHG